VLCPGNLVAGEWSRNERSVEEPAKARHIKHILSAETDTRYSSDGANRHTYFVYGGPFPHLGERVELAGRVCYSVIVRHIMHNLFPVTKTLSPFVCEPIAIYDLWGGGGSAPIWRMGGIVVSDVVPRESSPNLLEGMEHGGLKWSHSNPRTIGLLLHPHSGQSIISPFSHKPAA